MSLQETEYRHFVPERFGRVRVEAINAVRDTIVHIPDSRLGELTSDLDRSLQGPIGIKRAVVVKELFRSDSSKEYNFKLRVSGINSTESNALLRDSAVFGLVESMVDVPARYRMQLGIMFSSIRLDEFPESIRDALKIYHADTNFKLRQSYKDWNLCDHLEPFLNESIDTKKVVSVTDDNKTLMLMQFREKMAGICLESFVSETGKVFLEGNLYVPVGREFRGILQNVYDNGRDKIDLTEGSWVFMRPVRGIADKMMSAESVLKYAKAAR